MLRRRPLPAGVLPADGDASRRAGEPDCVQQVIQQQMQLMAQQLALLQAARRADADSGTASPAAAAAPSPPAPPTVPAAARRTPDWHRCRADEAAALDHSYDVKKAFGAIARIHTQPAQR